MPIPHKDCRTDAQRGLCAVLPYIDSNTRGLKRDWYEDTIKPQNRKEKTQQ